MTKSKSIATQISRVKARIKLLELATMALALATFTLVFLSTEIVLDRLYILDRAFRLVAFWGYVAVAGAGLFFAMALAARPISDLYAARLVEKHHPHLNQSLITYIQMQAGDASGSEYAQQLIEERLSNDLKSADLRHVVRSRLFSLVVTAALVVAAFVGTSAAVAGRGFVVCLERAVVPFRSVAPPTKTRIVEISPGDTARLTGSDVAIVARMEGDIPAEARVYLSYEEGAWFFVDMKSERDGWKATVPGGQSSFRYFIAASDTRSDIHAVRVLPPPILTNVHASVDLPIYAGSKKRDYATGDIEVLPGSYVALRGTPNRRLRGAQVIFDHGEKVQMRLVGDERAIAEFNATRSAVYRVHLEDEYGLTNPVPQTFRIEVRDDRAPDVSIASPAPVHEFAPAGDVDIVVDAVDDYALDKVELILRRRGQKPSRIVLPRPSNGRTHQAFTAGDLGLRAGESLLYWAEAADHAPTPNRGRSAIHVLHCRASAAEALAAFDPLAKQLRDIAADPDERDRLGLETKTDPDPEREKKKQEALEKLAKIAEEQRRLSDELRKITSAQQDELQKVREDLKRLAADQKRTREESRELPARGVQRQEALADLLARELMEQRQRAEAIRRLLEKLAQDPKASPARRKAIAEAARRLDNAARRLDEASRSMADKSIGESLDRQSEASREMDAALAQLSEQRASEMSAADRKRLEELAEQQKMLRERTEDLRRKGELERLLDELKEAERAMQETQRSLQQGQGDSASDSADAAADRLEKAEEDAGQPEPAPDQVPEELALALAEQLRKILAAQKEINASTEGVDTRRAQILSKEDREKLEELGKREDELARDVADVRSQLEQESAEVYRFTLDAVRTDMLEVRELMAVRTRSDAYVRHIQEQIVKRLEELIDALKPAKGGGGGGGGGKPGPKVGLLAQLKMLRSIQRALESRTAAIRTRYDGRETVEIAPADKQILDRILQEQEDLRRLVTKLAEELK